jgi:glyoxylase I family protein
MVNAMTAPSLPVGSLRRIHHIALNVKDLRRSCHFYGDILGLKPLTGDAIPSTLKSLVDQGKVANFITPDGTVIDLFFEPDLLPPAPDPQQQFSRTDHLAFDIAPEQFDQAIAVLKSHNIPIAAGPVTRPTGKGIYFYDPDGLQVEIRCDPLA